MCVCVCKPVCRRVPGPGSQRGPCQCPSGGGVGGWPVPPAVGDKGQSGTTVPFARWPRAPTCPRAPALGAGGCRVAGAGVCWFGGAGGARWAVTPALSPQAGAMARGGAGVAKRLGTLLSGLLECGAFCGVIFGWASLVFVLKSLDYFSELCHNVPQPDRNATLPGTRTGHRPRPHGGPGPAVPVPRVPTRLCPGMMVAHVHGVLVAGGCPTSLLSLWPCLCRPHVWVPAVLMPCGAPCPCCPYVCVPAVPMSVSLLSPCPCHPDALCLRCPHACVPIVPTRPPAPCPCPRCPDAGWCPVSPRCPRRLQQAG